MALLLGIDIGTSSTKALILDERGRVRASASAPHPIRQPQPGWSEQSPRDWWASTKQSVAAALNAAHITPDRADEIAAIGLSGQMHGSVLLDRQTLDAHGTTDDVLRPALLWNDQRTAAQCAEIEQLAGGRTALVKLVGNAALPGFTLPKWLWVKRHEPRVWDRVARVMMPKDYVRFRMTGLPATDAGDAAGTLLFDIDNRKWHADAARMFGIDQGLLPAVHESASIAGGLTPYAAGELGLKAGTPVVAGSGDNQCGAIGAGVVESDLLLATLGTSGVMYAHAPTPWRDLGGEPSNNSQAADSHGSASPSGSTPSGRVHTMCAANGDATTPSHWSITGCTLSAGGSLAWARDSVFGGVDYDTLLREAANVPPGSEGLMFLPYLTGERCPYPHPTASGAWIGLTARHTRGHLVRAVLEGVALTMAQILAIMRSTGVDARTCRLGGGGTRSPLWRDILTACLNTHTQTMETEEGPAYGAALLAGVGAGVWSSVSSACRATIRPAQDHEPIRGLAERYAAIAPIHAQCYADLRATMDRLEALRTPV